MENDKIKLYNNIIICGASGVGKDTVARYLFSVLKENKINSNLVLSNTTRPKREKEQQDKDYHFCSLEEFDSYDYFEQTEFRGWKYGTPAQNIKEKSYNIFVLNPEGIYTAIGKLDNYEIFYLYTSSTERFIRSIKRQNHFSFEILRRSITDFFDFWKFRKFCKKEKIVYHKIKNISTRHTVYLIRKILDILD